MSFTSSVVGETNPIKDFIFGLFAPFKTVTEIEDKKKVWS